MKAPIVLVCVALAGCPKPDGSAAPVDSGPPELRGRVFAQRIAELHLESPTGPVVGRIHPGAVVEVKPEDRTHLRVTLPDAFWKSKQDDLWVYADKDAFGFAFHAPEPITFGPESRLVREVMPLSLAPAADKLDEGFAQTICGEVHVFTKKGERPAKVAQAHAGVELMAWVRDEEQVKRGVGSCTTRKIVKEKGKLFLKGGATAADATEVTNVPAGFVRAEPHALDGGADALSQYIAAHRSVFWLIPNDNGTATCHEWTFTALADKDEALLRRKPIKVEKKPAYASYTFVYTARKSELLFFGPHYNAQPLDKNPKAETVGGYRCATSYWFAGMGDGAIRISNVELEPSLVAWSPDDEERWYTTAEACEAARPRVEAALAQAPDATPPGGVHRDCFGQFSETYD